MSIDHDQFLAQTVSIAERFTLLRDLRHADGMNDRKPQTDLEQQVSQQTEAAEKIANDPSIRARICAGAQSATANIKDIAKLVVASALPLSLAGTITIPFTPILAAAVVIIIIDSGISAYCKEK
ncbi:MAG: hypothetical protein HYR56_33910 [Acidobacteria bacterium]|nr:hypothetical protein [Acidobacteriota bacterium]MBI3427554.1 hypothetical protein [Acidobacteriota bacterium]